MSMFTKEDKKRYISILGDGKFHETVPAGTEDAILREYETSDGKKGSKWEMVYSKIQATITDIAFFDGDYGVNMQMTVQGDEGEAVISVGTETTFGEDIMKKLPNVDFSKPVVFAPYAFADEHGKNVRGVSLYQDGKIKSFFYDSENKVNINGYPNAKDKEDMSKAKWKIFFLEAREFLIGYTKTKVVPKVKNATPSKPKDDGTDEEGFEKHIRSQEEIDEGIDISEVPF